MDYLLFLTGLFLLAAAAGCLFLFREDRQFSRWPLLALALTALGLKVWFGILVFAMDMHGSAILVHALLGAGFAASMLGFCLSPMLHGSRSARLVKGAATVVLFALTFGTGLAHPNAAGFIAPLLAVTFAGAWKIARFGQGRFATGKASRPWVMALLLTAIVAICLLPDAVACCYDLNGQGPSPARIAFLGTLAAATLCSLVFCWLLWWPIYQANHDQLPGHLVRRRRIVTAVILAAAVFTCANGAWLAHWLGEQAQQERSTTLLSALHLGANNLNPSQIKQLQGLPQEVASANYSSLRTKLLQVREAMPGVRFTYVLGFRNQRLVFLVDAEDPAAQETFSPPGEPVKDYPEKWLPELAGASTFNGPDRDEWGVWFAACVPIRDQDRKVVALLGIDYPAAKWLQPLAARRLAVMVVTCSVALLLLTLFGFHIATKDAELNLLRSRAEADRLALVARRTDNAVVITDTAGMIEWVNEGFTKISGYSKEEVVGKSPGSVLQHPGDNPTERARMRACIQAGLGFESEIINYGKSGHAYIVHIECQPLVDKNGTLTGFMAIERDVTQTRRSSKLLEAVAATSGKLLSSRLESTVWGEILAALGSAANADRCYIFHIHPHPVLGTPAMSQTAEWNSGAATPQLQNPALQNFSFHENGYGRWLPELHAGHVISGTVPDFPIAEQAMLIAQEIRSLAVVPIFTGEQLTGFMGFDACHEDRLWESWEISILRSAAANIGLRQVVQNEADALVLARDEAHHAALAAEAANRAKSTFLATMSHEIRTPLNAVIGMASLLETTPLNAQQQDFADTILNSSNFLLELITDLLDYSRIESGSIDLEAAPFILADLCREAFDVVRPGAMGKHLELSCQLAPQLPSQVEGDRARIRQILVNLLSNAVKFTPAGCISLRVDGQQHAAGPWHLTFEVKDSGIGIAPDAIERLFVPFVQVDSSSTRRFGGSGLGLAISKRLAAVMGGDITVHSTPGQGSTFRVALTLSSARQPATAPTARPADEGEPARIAKLRTLVAEDNPNNQKIIRLLLQRLGIAADIVANGREALEAARANRYDVIILDLQMPVMDGLEASRKIRDLDLAQRPSIVALTANAFQEDRDAAIAAGMDDYLSKPITLDRLREMLAKLTSALQRPPEPVPQPAAMNSTIPAPIAESALIDTRQLDTFIDLGSVAYHDILGDLIRDVPASLEHLRAVIQAGDTAACKRRAHSLKGILACFGCVAMTARLAELEQQEGDAAPEHATPLHAELQDLWQRSLSAIREWEKSVPAFST
ncbi:MAG: ATP-binding protein [Verrucomicrobia bacterium]|nr:ATP-binding protein [Verrucomicrobiota bacterium]